MLPTVSDILPNQRRLRLARLGSGPPLLLLHGYPDNLQIWCELAPQLAERRQVIAFDWPGMGQSEAWPGGATPMHMAERLLWLLDAWHLDRADLCGLDMGAQPALVFAACYPERIGRLVVMNSLVFGDEVTSWEIRLLRRFGWNRFILRHLPWLVFRRARRTFLPRGVDLPAPLFTDMWGSFPRACRQGPSSPRCAPGYQGTLPRAGLTCIGRSTVPRWCFGVKRTGTFHRRMRSGCMRRSPVHACKSSRAANIGCRGIAPTTWRPGWRIFSDNNARYIGQLQVFRLADKRPGFA